MAAVIPLVEPPDTQPTVAPEVSAPLAPGFELPPYRILELLAVGGMGEVYLATHQTLGRQVAIKVLNAQASSNPDLVRRFFTEARAVNAVNHENIVEIHDFVAEPDAGGRNYYVMELLQGADSAKARETQGPFTLQRLLGVSLQLSSALQAAHDKGIIHRDLKPENVFLVERAGVKDFVKLVDFGIAKLSGDGFANTPHTMAGLIIGTPEYMSPEQAGARPVDARSDIYSLGILLYWMLSDRLPFRASAFDKLILARLTTDPPPLGNLTACGEPLSAALSQVVMRCLAREPVGRFQSMTELGVALERLRATPMPLRPRRSARPVALAALALAVIAGGALAWVAKGRATIASQPPPSPPVAIEALPAPASTELKPLPMPPAAAAAAPAPGDHPRRRAHAAANPSTPKPVKGIINPYDEE